MTRVCEVHLEIQKKERKRGKGRIINYRCRYVSPFRKSVSSRLVRTHFAHKFQRSLCRGRDTDPRINEKGDGEHGKNMDRLGYFGHVAIVAHFTFQLILLLAPGKERGGGSRGWVTEMGERILRDGRRIDIIFTGKSLLSRCFSIWLRVTSNDTGAKGRGSVKFAS